MRSEANSDRTLEIAGPYLSEATRYQRVLTEVTPIQESLGCYEEDRKLSADSGGGQETRKLYSPEGSGGGDQGATGRWRALSDSLHVFWRCADKMCRLPGCGNRGDKEDPRAAIMTLLTKRQETEGRAGLVGACAGGNQVDLDVLNSDAPNRCAG